MKINWKSIITSLCLFYICLVSVTGGAFSFLFLYFLVFTRFVVNWFTMILANIVSSVLLYLAIKHCIKMR